MLADIEPSRQITGGAWYNEQEFDSEYITILSRACHTFVRNPVCKHAPTPTPLLLAHS